jgi:hypothetical protein
MAFILVARRIDRQRRIEGTRDPVPPSAFPLDHRMMLKLEAFA